MARLPVQFEFDQSCRLCTFTSSLKWKINTTAELVNMDGLVRDLSKTVDFIEWCDIRFLVGKDKTPVYGVSSILMARSSFFKAVITDNLENLRNKSSPRKVKLSMKRKLISKVLHVAKGNIQKLPTDAMIQDKQPQEIHLPHVEEHIFRSVLTYIYSGNARIDIHNVVAIMNAAEAFCIPELRTACLDYARSNITEQSALPLLSSTCKYEPAGSNKMLQGYILNFIKEKAETVLKLAEFYRLSRQEVVLIMFLDNLKAKEDTKWNAALQWSRRFCKNNGNALLQKTIKLFIHRINFRQLSASKLENEVRPLKVIPDVYTD